MAKITLKDIVEAIGEEEECTECQLGDEVFDRVSGFRGTVTAICSYLGASTQVEVTRQDDAAEKWLPLDRLELHIGEDYE